MHGRKGRPEWYVLGKPHGDRAKQFKPFAALRGYDGIVEDVIEESESNAFDQPDLGTIIDRILDGSGSYEDVERLIGRDVLEGIDIPPEGGCDYDCQDNAKCREGLRDAYASDSMRDADVSMIEYGFCPIGDDDVP